jgi:hypothetical protein
MRAQVQNRLSSWNGNAFAAGLESCNSALFSCVSIVSVDASFELQLEMRMVDCATRRRRKVARACVVR